MGSHTRRAHAKLNLVLSVGPPEPPGSVYPGWHPIASWMVALDLCDEVRIEPLGKGDASSFTVRFADDAPRPSAIDWAIEKDLGWRAHRALEGHVGHPIPTRIEVLKRIPVGAGLGGGSSNASAVLVGLNVAHGLGVGTPELARLGAALGSDVPFFIDEEREIARPALVMHMGERLERLDPVHAEVVLIVPPFGCATPAVYRAFDDLLGSGGTGVREAQVRAIATHHVLDPGVLFNDLERAACTIAPELGRLKAHATLASGLPVHLTGSGSAMFIVCPPERARALATRLAEDPMLAGCALIATHMADGGRS
jgi:4-diphosphocytidyl-2-C-methyl-D-erythritol kinase